MGYVRWLETGAIIEKREYEFESPPLPPRKGKEARNGARRRFYSVEDGNRAKGRFLRLCNGNVPEHGVWWVTLTPAQNLDVRHAWPAFQRFIKRCRSLFGSDFQYVAVIEKQARGAFHIHAIFWAFGSGERFCLNERHGRYFAEAWRLGFVDLVKVGNAGRMVGYIAKYIVKGWDGTLREGEKGLRRYVVSSKVERTRVVEVGSDTEQELTKAGVWVTEWTGSVRSAYIGKVDIIRFRNLQYADQNSSIDSRVRGAKLRIENGWADEVFP